MSIKESVELAFAKTINGKRAEDGAYYHLKSPPNIAQISHLKLFQ